MPKPNTTTMICEKKVLAQGLQAGLILCGCSLLHRADPPG